MLKENTLSLIAKHLEELPEELWINLDGMRVQIPELDNVSEGEHDDGLSDFDDED